ncbi:hypothetical protein D1AOALGA4SA_3661 [Olavius algarvensis Delta 1 endosymbiont]|nr:hypothetical protein D1AOALGA4SA_3661 [Olavius algarvensis Delta 1 endosymbiont]
MDYGRSLDEVRAGEFFQDTHNFATIFHNSYPFYNFALTLEYRISASRHKFFVTNSYALRPFPIIFLKTAFLLSKS